MSLHSETFATMLICYRLEISIVLSQPLTITVFPFFHIKVTDISYNRLVPNDNHIKKGITS